jgi:hypothetical protein
MQNKTAIFNPLDAYAYYSNHFNIITSNFGGDYFYIDVLDHAGNLVEQKKVETSCDEFFKFGDSEVLDDNFESLKTKYIFDLSNIFAIRY